MEPKRKSRRRKVADGRIERRDWNQEFMDFIRAPWIEDDASLLNVDDSIADCGERENRHEPNEDAT